VVRGESTDQAQYPFQVMTVQSKLGHSMVCSGNSFLIWTFCGKILISFYPNKVGSFQNVIVITGQNGSMWMFSARGNDWQTCYSATVNFFDRGKEGRDILYA
jgi:hypothetical protein